jgi:threonine dehydrogenase-like Zn-dependent dehydrogenase
MRVRAAVALAAVALAAVIAAQALAAAATILASPSTVRRGHVVRVHGTVHGCPRGDQVTLISKAFSRRHEFAGVPAVSATVGTGGNYSVRTRIPSRRSPGRYGITGRCGGGNLGVSATLRVLR